MLCGCFGGLSKCCTKASASARKNDEDRELAERVQQLKRELLCAQVGVVRIQLEAVLQGMQVCQLEKVVEETNGDGGTPTFGSPNKAEVVPAPPESFVRASSAPIGSVELPLEMPNLRRLVSERPPSATVERLSEGRHQFTETTLERLTSATVSEVAPEGDIPPVQPVEVPIVADAPLMDTFGCELAGDLHPRLVRKEVAEGAECMICGDSGKELFSPDTLCASRNCEGAFCQDCLSEYYKLSVEASRFAVPFLRCPSCRGYIRTGAWQQITESSIITQWEENADNLLSLRCIECDSPGTLRVTGQVEGDARAEALKILTESFSEEFCITLHRSWIQFSCGEVDAAEIFTVLVSGDEKFNESGENPPSDELQAKLHALVKLVADPARRAVLQLAILRRWPKTRSQCCDVAHCFKCKVGDHHDGITCEEVQRRQMQEEDCVQFCPGCGVATMKTEGCNHMICLCGEDWQWEGEEVWVNEWADDVRAEQEEQGNDDENVAPAADEGGTGEGTEAEGAASGTGEQPAAAS